MWYEINKRYVGTKQIRPDSGSIEDYFTWTTLNTDIWDYKIYTSWSYTVNNWLTINWGSWWSWTSYWIAVYTKKKFTWNEKKITAEYTITMDWWTYRESQRWLLYNVSTAYFEVDQYMSAWNNTSRVELQTWASSRTSYQSVSIVNATYIWKIIIDVENNTYALYINGNLHYQWTLQYALSNKIWDPIFAFMAKSRTTTTCTCTHVKIDIED